MNLTPAAQQRALAFLAEHGRPLDRALHAYHFTGGDRAAVLAALAPYQNPDGGFGHALEPDVRTPASSAIATSHGLAILREVGAPADDPRVRRAVDYLLATFDPARRVWPIVPPEVDEAPRAFWWEYAESAANFGDFLANPRATLLGHLYHYAALTPAGFLDGVAGDVVAHLEARDDDIPMYDLFCYMELAGAPNAPEAVRRPIAARLRRVIPQVLETDSAQWASETVFKPLAVAPAPDAPLAAAVPPALVDANLDVEIANQLADGSWPLGWSWAVLDADAWARAEREWKGHVIVLKLRTFRAYGRLD